VVGLLIGVFASAGAQADAIIELQSHAGTVAITPLGPLSATSTSARSARCLASATGSVPFGMGSARGSVSVLESVRCPSNTPLLFLPALLFSNGLAAPTRGTLDAQLALTAFSGTTSMVTSLNLYLQLSGAGNPILTNGHIVIKNGAITSSTTSTAAIAAGILVGPGFHMTLQSVPGGGSVTLVVVLNLSVPGPTTIAEIGQEQLTLVIQY
jgi:hypothetical protein